mmetsp:Transcript_104297/g.300636  ORF Transcript_104297/g.300636 Transcript_104297/m.300636 type:complete len:362 (-) Transcript_104297:219-1304(-)
MPRLRTALGLSIVAATASVHATTNLPVDDFPYLMAAYQSWGECDDNVYTTVQNGANVIIWFATNLASDEDGNAAITGGPNRDCVVEKINTLESMGFGRDKVKHLISIGGWDAAHPDTTHTAEEYFTAWESFSDGLYDGLDWDLEGNDNLQSEWNYFSKPCLELMADFSKLIHDAGYIVSLVPPESYLDVQTTEFSRYVNLTFPGELWPGENSTNQFSYHGHNSYAYPLAKYPDAFDMVSVQIYETKSHAAYNTSVLGVDQVEYMKGYINRLLGDGLTVDFSTDPDFAELGTVTIDLTDKLLIGLISDSGVGGPITAANTTAAFEAVAATGAPNVRGAFYWCISGDANAELPATFNEFFQIV